MPKLLEDLIRDHVGKTYNWLTIIEIYRNDKHMLRCKCKCICGSIKDCELRCVISGRTKSCGCYVKSNEFRTKQAQWVKDNPDELIKRNAKISKTCSEWVKHNTDKVTEIRKSFKDWCKLTRQNSNLDKLLEVIHPKYVNDLINGNLSTTAIIETKCPICGMYAQHILNHVFCFSRGNFRRGNPILCNNCKMLTVTSAYEQEIADYVSTFYNGECIRNSRNIISPQELDLYYPEKKIAIEFNGDYWHSELFKGSDYHYNKFKNCMNKGVLLVSIFESKWLANKQLIKDYIADIFSDKDNQLSFLIPDYMNNNYPSVNCNISESIVTDSYTFNNVVIHTCGYSKIVN